MKWRELCRLLVLRKPEDQPDDELIQHRGQYFTRMAAGGTFRFVSEYLVEDQSWFSDQDLLATIIQVRVLENSRLEVTIRTLGPVPPGFRQGKYKLVSDRASDGTSYVTPKEMFEDEEVPEGEFDQHWHQAPYPGEVY